MTPTFADAVVILERESRWGQFRRWMITKTSLWKGKRTSARHFIKNEILPKLKQTKAAVEDFEGPASEVSTQTTGRQIGKVIRRIIDKANLTELKDRVEIFRDKWLSHSEVEKSAFPIESEINKRLNILMGGFKKLWDLANEVEGARGELDTKQVQNVKNIYAILRDNARALESLFDQMRRGD